MIIIHVVLFRCWFLSRYGAANMVAVKPMMHQQQPGGAKPNMSYNNNNGGVAALSMQQEQSITKVKAKNIALFETLFLCQCLKKPNRLIFNNT